MQTTQTAKQTASAPWAEFEVLLDQATKATGSTVSGVLSAIGYTGSGNASVWKQQGEVPLRAKLALRGLLVELEVATHHQVFAFEELTAMFAALNGYPLPEPQRKNLIRKLAKEMANGS